MNRARRRTRFGPPSILLGTAVLLSAAIPAIWSAESPRTLADARCPATPSEAARAAGRAIAGGRASVRVEQVVSRRGELTGRVLDVHGASDASLAVALPTESFVGQPVGDLVVYTTYTASAGSAVHLVDLVNGCDVIAVSPAEIVRSALVDPRGAAIYVHSVNRVGRRDNGVQRIDLASAASTLVVPPLPPSDAVGPTFATELRWSLDGNALAVQSCGFEACRTRVLSIDSGSVATFDAPGQGALIGLTSQHLLTLGACAGLPCSVLSIDLSTAATSVLADAAWSATLASGPDGSGVVTIDTDAGTTEVIQ